MVVIQGGLQDGLEGRTLQARDYFRGFFNQSACRPWEADLALSWRCSGKRWIRDGEAGVSANGPTQMWEGTDRSGRDAPKRGRCSIPGKGSISPPSGPDPEESLGTTGKRFADEHGEQCYQMTWCSFAGLPSHTISLCLKYILNKAKAGWGMGGFRSQLWKSPGLDIDSKSPWGFLVDWAELRAVQCLLQNDSGNRGMHFPTNQINLEFSVLRTAQYDIPNR